MTDRLSTHCDRHPDRRAGVDRQTITHPGLPCIRPFFLVHPNVTHRLVDKTTKRIKTHRQTDRQTIHHAGTGTTNTRINGMTDGGVAMDGGDEKYALSDLVKERKTDRPTDRLLLQVVCVCVCHRDRQDSLLHSSADPCSHPGPHTHRHVNEVSHSLPSSTHGER